MRLQFIITVNLIFLLLPILTCAQSQIEKQNQIVDRLYSVFNKGKRPGCSIAIIKNGEKVYQNNFGLANLENEVPISDSTLFFLASVTKQFTGYGVSKLIEEKKLDYNSSLSQYFPDVNPLWDSIRIRHLVHHTTGIWDWPYLFLATGHSFDDVLDKKGIFRLIKNQAELSFQPGSKYQYTSSNYMLLGEVLRKVIVSDYYDWMKKHVLNPAGMSNSFFQKSHHDVINNRASGYLFKQNRYCRTTNNLSPIGTGFIYSNIEDMTNWMIHVLASESRITSLMLKTGQLNNGEEIPYAFGLMKRGKKIYWHDGYLQGFRTITILNPKEKFALVLLSNSGSNYIVRSAFTIANMYLSDTIPEAEIENYRSKFLKEPQRKRNPEKELKYSQDINEFKGIYINRELLITYRIYEKNDSLFAINSIEEILLKPLKSNQDVFGSDKFLLGDFHFERNVKEKIVGFKIRQRRNNIIKFERIKY